MKEAVVCSTHIVYNLIFFSLKKLRGPQGGPEGDPDGGPEAGVQVLCVPNCDG